MELRCVSCERNQLRCVPRTKEAKVCFVSKRKRSVVVRKEPSTKIQTVCFKVKTVLPSGKGLFGWSHSNSFVFCFLVFRFLRNFVCSLFVILFFRLVSLTWCFVVKLFPFSFSSSVRVFLFFLSFLYRSSNYFDSKSRN